MSYGREHRLPLSAKRVSLVSAAALIGTLVLSASPGAADPDKSNGASSGDKPSISEVKERLDTLNHQAEIASENLNTVGVQMQEASSVSRRCRPTWSASVPASRLCVTQVVGSALADYQNGGGLSTSTSFLVADDPGAFMNGVASKAMVEHQQTGLLSKLTQQQRQLERPGEAGAERGRRDRQGPAPTSRPTSRSSPTSTQQAQDLLDGLEAAERARLLACRPPPSPRYTEQPSPQRAAAAHVSRRACLRVALQVAVQTALAQVGDPYVYGAAGPDAFDCSGLTMYAWAAAGVSIAARVERLSRRQAHRSRPRPADAGRPDLLLLADLARRHVHRRRQIVHAPHTGTTVQIASIYSMPINHAMHIG